MGVVNVCAKSLSSVLGCVFYRSTSCGVLAPLLCLLGTRTFVPRDTLLTTRCTPHACTPCIVQTILHKMVRIMLQLALQVT